jgi:hypothetical protein
MFLEYSLELFVKIPVGLLLATLDKAPHTVRSRMLKLLGSICPYLMSSETFDPLIESEKELSAKDFYRLRAMARSGIIGVECRFFPIDGFSIS